MNNNIIKQLTEENLILLNINSISLISEYSFKPRYIIKFSNNEQKSFDENNFTKFITKSLRTLKIKKLT